LHDLAVKPGLLDLGARRRRADRLDRRDLGRADAVDRGNAFLRAGAAAGGGLMLSLRLPFASGKAKRPKPMASRPMPSSASQTMGKSS